MDAGHLHVMDYFHLVVLVLQKLLPLTKSNPTLNGANKAYLLEADRGAVELSSGFLWLWRPCFHVNSSSVCLSAAAVSALCTHAVFISCVTLNWRGCSDQPSSSLSWGTHMFNIFFIFSNILLRQISCYNTACSVCSSLEDAHIQCVETPI